MARRKPKAAATAALCPFNRIRPNATANTIDINTTKAANQQMAGIYISNRQCDACITYRALVEHTSGPSALRKDGDIRTWGTSRRWEATIRASSEIHTTNTELDGTGPRRTPHKCPKGHCDSIVKTNAPADRRANTFRHRVFSSSAHPNPSSIFAIAKL